MMTRRQIVEFIQRNPAGFVATQSPAGPRVRGVMTAWAEVEEGVVISTSTRKDFWRQLQADPRVQVCWYSRDEDLQLRIAGRAELLTDEETRTRVLRRFAFLAGAVERYGRESIVAFRLARGRCRTWSDATRFEEPEEFDF